MTIGGISIDSRKLGAGDFFVAIRGERFDGHQFVGDVLARGASGVLLDTLPGELASRRDGAANAPVVIRAKDTTVALQAVARHVRRLAGSRVVAITGSAGKTTTKEVTAEFLSARYRVFRNKGNLNNHIGLPLSLLELRQKPDVAVVELGMNHPGEIRTLVGIAEPDVRVWTNVGDAHLGFFASPDAIADAKGEVLDGAKPGDVLVANANDPRVMSRARAFKGRLVTFGLGVVADVQATGIEVLGLEGTVAHVRTPAGAARVQTPLPGLGNLANVLAATAVALELGVPLSDVVERARGLRPAARRGEILELGAHSERLHVECGRAAAAAGLDWLVTVGGAPARALAEAAVAAGMRPAAVTHVATREDAAAAALERVRPGDLILVKG